MLKTYALAVLFTFARIANAAEPIMPDPVLTPGSVFLHITKKEVCVVGYTSTVRDVSLAKRKQVFALYKIDYKDADKYEVDHLISLQLGGNNDIKNLWPSPYLPKPGAREKDVVENYLNRQVCKGIITLEQAQKLIVTDWWPIYKELKAKQQEQKK